MRCRLAAMRECSCIIITLHSICADYSLHKYCEAIGTVFGVQQISPAMLNDPPMKRKTVYPTQFRRLYSTLYTTILTDNRHFCARRASISEYNNAWRDYVCDLRGPPTWQVRRTPTADLSPLTANTCNEHQSVRYQLWVTLNWHRHQFLLYL